MASQPRSASSTGSSTGADDPATRVNYGGAQQPGAASAAGHPNGGGFPLPVPGLPSNVDPKRVLWWGGLAALAAVGVIEWPVAAVVGAGSYVAERLARDDARRDRTEPS
jgi:hypothetical protein